MKKVTNEQRFAEVRALVEASNVENQKELLDFIDSRIEAEEKVKARRAAHPAVKKANPEVEARKATVLAVLTADEMTSKEVAEKTGLTAGQASAALVALAKAGSITKVDNGKKPNTYKVNA